MEDEGFQSIDQTTQQAIKQRQLEHSLKNMAARCLQLSQSLKKQKQHSKQVSQISCLFDQKLGQMSQLLIDFLALQNYIMKQVDMLEQVGGGIKLVKDGLSLEIGKIRSIGSEISKGSMEMMEWKRFIEEHNRTIQKKYEQIIESKSEQIESLKLALQKITQTKTQQKNMFEMILNKMTVVEGSVEGLKTNKGSNTKAESEIKMLENKCLQYQRQIQRLNQELLGTKNFGLTYRYEKPKYQVKYGDSSKPPHNPFKPPDPIASPFQMYPGKSTNQYPYSKQNKIQSTVNQNQHKIILGEMEKLFSFAVQNLSSMISRSSNQLMSQLSEKDSLQKMSQHKHQTKMSLQEIRKKLTTIDNSSKKTIQNLITEVKLSIKQMLVGQTSTMIPTTQTHFKN